MLFSVTVVITSDTFHGMSSTAVWVNRPSSPDPAPRSLTSPGRLMPACLRDEVHEAVHARGCLHCLGRRVTGHGGRSSGEGNTEAIRKCEVNYTDLERVCR